MNIKANFLLQFFVCIAVTINAQNMLEHVHPLNWYVGMKNPKLQLLLHGKNIAELSVEINNKNIVIEKVHKVENPNYLFVDLDLSRAEAGFFDIILKQGTKQQHIHKYELKPRNPQNGRTRVQGVTAKDFIYLLMPDRFSDGDSTNNTVKGMRDTRSRRDDMHLRHGGDFKGIQNHLDYFEELGVTTLWLTPVIENDMPEMEEASTKRSFYHGYAFTNHYQVDERFGGNDGYLELIDAVHQRGLKIIQDNVYNHVGIYHWFIQDMPMKDWIHQWSEYTQTSFREQPSIDRYASQYDFNISKKGWFQEFMPDLNQGNPYVSKYLIQNAIWITEYYGIDGWRIDTYFYSEDQFLYDINEALLREFPTITMFGETWLHSVINCAFYCDNTMENLRFKHNLQGVTDFPIYYAINDALTQDYGWTNGVNRLYMTLQEDILYKNPYRNCLFLDNHDLDRFYSVIGEDIKKYKIGITWLFTLRGIPQLYYGTEILMKNFKDPSDAAVRKNFPGGWATDKVNKFTEKGRTKLEKEAFNYVKKLAHYRKTSTALTTGNLMQFLPFNDGIYAYFRYDDQQTVMVISNTSKEKQTVDCSRFAERMDGFISATNIITGETLKQIKTLKLKPQEILVLELKK